MTKKLAHGKPSPAMVVALLALIVALGGTAYAASSLPKNSVGSKQLKKNAVTTAKIRNGAVTGKKIKLRTLGTVPSANHANSADAATSAGNATHATGADNATNANHASSADRATTASNVTGNSGPLAAGQTERGDWGAWGTNSSITAYMGEAVTFPIPLASGLDHAHVHWIPKGTAAPTGCTGGTAAEPKADSGNLCVYEITSGASSFGAIFPQHTGLGGSDAWGFGINFLTTGTAGGAFDYGTWAVTG